MKPRTLLKALPLILATACGKAPESSTGGDEKLVKMSTDVAGQVDASLEVIDGTHSEQASAEQMPSEPAYMQALKDSVPDGMPELSFRVVKTYSPKIMVTREYDWGEFAAVEIPEVIRRFEHLQAPGALVNARAAELSIFRSLGQFDSDTDASAYREIILPEIYQDDELLEEVYQWLMPGVAFEFAALGEAEQQEYLDLASFMKSYLEDYDHEKERDYLKVLEQNGASEYFILYPPGDDWRLAEAAADSKDWKGVPDAYLYRKAQAWVFRRIEAGHFTVQELLEWVSRVQRDLKKAK
jgi:hypothetical protein